MKKELIQVSEIIKNHLVGLGCTLLSDEEKYPFHAWEVVLPFTDAGKLTLSISNIEFDNNKTGTLMVHGRFEQASKFPKEFCYVNKINPYSGKWNEYVDAKNQTELNKLLRYYNRMIPILDTAE